MSIYKDLDAKEKFFVSMKLHYEFTHKNHWYFFQVIGFILYFILLCAPIYAIYTSLKLLFNQILIINLMFIPVLIFIAIIFNFIRSIIISKTIDKYGYEFKKLKYVWIPLFYLTVIFGNWFVACRILLFVFLIYFLALGSEFTFTE